MPAPGSLSGHFLSKQQTFAPVQPTVASLPVARSKKKLKALHWEKVDETVTTHWAAHTPSAEEREEKYNELSRKGILDEVEKLFMAKETKLLGASSGKKDDKKQIISTDLRKAYGEPSVFSFPFFFSILVTNPLSQKSPWQSSPSTPWTRWSR
jgi:cytokinesis protein